MPTSETHDQVQWQAQHPAMLLFGFGKLIRGTLVPLIFGGYLAIQGSTFILFIFVVTGLLIPGIGLLLRFASYRYGLHDGQILIREGVFNKKMRSIPVRRIHNINTSQGPFARIFGVTKVDIETAGGKTAEASISALTKEATEELRQFISEEKAALNESDTSKEVKEEGQPIYRIDMKSLLIAGATNNKLGLVFVGIAAFFQVFESRFEQIIATLFNKLSATFAFLGEKGPLSIFVAIASLVVIGFGVGVFLGIVMAILSLYRFTLKKIGEDLSMTSGLLTLRDYALPKDKIQAIKGHISMLRRPLGYMELRARSAGRIGAGEDQATESDLLIPLTPKRECARYTQAIWPRSKWENTTWKEVHPFTRLQQFRLLGLLIFLLSLFSLNLPFNQQTNYIVIGTINFFGILFSWFVADLTYKQTAYSYDGNFVYIKRGFIGLQFWLIPVGKIQNVKVKQTPFQRRRALVSLDLDIAGARPGEKATIPNIPIAEGWRYFNTFSHTLVGREDEAQ